MQFNLLFKLKRRSLYKPHPFRLRYLVCAALVTLQDTSRLSGMRKSKIYGDQIVYEEFRAL